MDDAQQGRLPQALAHVDAQLQGENANDVLLNLEKGELLRMASSPDQSLAALGIADAAVKTWEDAARGATTEVLRQAGATLMGDGSREYEVQDYEKVMLTTVMALNRLSAGDLENARVDIKRTHEREAIIAEYRSRLTLAAEEEAKEKGAQVQSTELKGYPIETLEDPEVLALMNGYQNALSHYLSGFVYEALNEPGLAAPGYRTALELRPGTPVLESALAGLDGRPGEQLRDGATDVLFVIEAGHAPARQSRRFMFPVPTPGGLITVGISYPVIEPTVDVPEIGSIRIGETELQAGLVADFNVMARRALKDDLPGMQARAAVRMVAKAAAQAVVNREMGPLAGLLGNIVAAVAEPPADDRMWRSLPGRVYVARGFFKPGDYELALPGTLQPAQQIKVSGRHMVVPVRAFPAVAYYGRAGHFGDLASLQAKPPTADEASPAKKAPRARKAARSASLQ
ncbi:Uncharacterized protein conserved in bacteria [Bordetella ansorpii]|uniref:Uncharacterized protein conserved in bacteria n=1 Tax=Bordetella ansorpii TaxID=288768 RepID=A0A157Q849_9BORD|nr:hypothetical protein [Bordetella ansorpii]SAI42105.1 Uncharacterized protein conserved in bacteria [Bordetella ansorpii]